MRGQVERIRGRVWPKLWVAALTLAALLTACNGDGGGGY